MATPTLSGASRNARLGTDTYMAQTASDLFFLADDLLLRHQNKMFC